MTTSLRMEDWSHMTARILDLTLEIIYLVTGENYKIVKEASGEPLTPSSHRHGPSPITERPPHSLMSERNKKKIVEVINKMIELLTGELPIRCQDIAVYFTMQEWQYLEEHKEFYKDAIIKMQPPITSPDRSNTRTPPVRYTGPHLSRDCSQEDHTIPPHYQNVMLNNLSITVKEEVKEEEGADSVMEEAELSGGHKDLCSDVKIESSINTIPPERSTGPLYPLDCAQEDYSYALQYQAEKLTDIKHEIKEEEEETEVTGAWQCMEEGDMMGTSELGMPVSGRNYVRNPWEVHPISHPDGATEDDGVTQCSPITGNTHHRDHSADGSPSDPEESPGQPHLMKAPSNAEDSYSNISADRYGTGKRLCSECGECFGTKYSLTVHLKTHLEGQSNTCSECGKGFTEKKDLLQHHKTHTGPFTCLHCGKHFVTKGNFVKHQRYFHESEQTFSGSERGKVFSKNSNLFKLQTNNTGVRPIFMSRVWEEFFKKQ